MKARSIGGGGGGSGGRLPVPHCEVPGWSPWHQTDLLSSQISARPEAHADWLAIEAFICGVPSVKRIDSRPVVAKSVSSTPRAGPFCHQPACLLFEVTEKWVAFCAVKMYTYGSDLVGVAVRHHELTHSSPASLVASQVDLLPGGSAAAVVPLAALLLLLLLLLRAATRRGSKSSCISSCAAANGSSPRAVSS